MKDDFETVRRVIEFEDKPTALKAIDRIEVELESYRQTCLDLGAEVERLRQELHQAKAEWFEEKKRARQAEAEVERLRNITYQVTDLKNEVERLREQGGLYVEALDDKDAEVERLTMDVEGTHRENERLREERDSSASNWGKERELRAEVERLRAALREIADPPPLGQNEFFGVSDVQVIARRALEGSDRVRLGDENPLRRALEGSE